MSRRPLTAVEIETLVGDRDILPFLNTRNELYRERAMKENPPTRSEAIRLMAENPNLIRRPLLAADGEVILGFDEDEYRRASLE